MPVVSGGALQLNTGLGFAVGKVGEGKLAVDGVVEDPAAYDMQTGTITPTTPLDGTKVFTLATTAGGGGPAFNHLDRSEYTVTTANASSLPTSLALCKALVAAYNAHRVDVLAHVVADTTNTVAATVASIIGLPTAITAANQLKTAFNNHPNAMGVHLGNMGSFNITSPDASDQSSLNTLLNEIKTDFNAHMASGATTPSWRVGAA
jgi:hypothetical protein